LSVHIGQLGQHVKEVTHMSLEEKPLSEKP